MFIEGFYAGISTMVPALYNQGNLVGSTDVDYINLKLNHPITQAVVYSSTSLLKNDGNVTFLLPPLTGPHYLKINQRNTIETWSTNPVAIPNSPQPYPLQIYDFTTSSMQAFGANQVYLDGNVWGFYSVDINQDGGIDNSDFSLWELSANSFITGSTSADLTGDGSVGNTDFTILENNSSLLSIQSLHKIEANC
jgi:hypothetical protein